MKIRTQLNLLVLGMVLIPFACLTAIPVFQYFTSPQRYLLKGYKEIRALNGIDLSEDDWNNLEEQLKAIPINVQTIVYHDARILISSFPDIKAGTEISPVALFDYIRSTSDTYDYQVQSPILRRKFRNTPPPETPAPLPDAAAAKQAENTERIKFLVVSRSKVPPAEKNHFSNAYLPVFIALLIFEAFCITVILNLSHTIATSITLLEKSTQKIANGELDTKIGTHYTRSRNEITSLSESLEKMRVSLKDDLERRTKFIMGISHDLRTPVSLIKGYAEAISDGVVDDMDSVKKSLAIIHAKADQLETMINDLINYVKLNNTDWRQTLEITPIASIVENFARSATATAEVYKRTIETSVQVDPGISVAMDKNLFDRAMENIFTNALRYTKDGDTIRIVARDSADAVTVSIEDTGIGIEPKDLEHIYDLFYRGTNSRREGGMGIGLSVVKTIVDTHGWDISVQSQPGKGTCFTIRIPRG